MSLTTNTRRVTTVDDVMNDSATASSLALARDVLTGLSQPQKTLPCIWFYDHRGSQLFEDITRLPEYYPTRTETRLLRGLVDEVAATLGPQAQLIELGSGSSIKTRLLLQALPELAAYVPVDISEAFLNDAVVGLLRDFPQLLVQPVVADFTAPFALPRLPTQRHGQHSPRLGFFPGSTIGNFSPQAATNLLAQFAQALGPQAWLLIGVDTTQNPSLLVPAYDDAQGVTAAFNRNLLLRINRELSANFSLRHFHHAARFDALLGRIEMHLVSEVQQTVTVLGHRFDFKAGESIHTENAYKYTAPAFLRLARNAGWREHRTWCDTEGTGFSVFLMRSAG
ncbi:MAG: L-histidine N(alpha)-methyltransferase [Burkholderiales bacterium]